MIARDVSAAAPLPSSSPLGHRFGGVIVPVDFGRLGDRALPIARVLAARGAIPVHLVTTISPGLDDKGDRAELVRRALALDATYVQLHVQHTDDVSAGLASAIDAVNAPLVCIATHARGVVGEAILGSPTEELLRATRAPAVLVGPDCNTDGLPLTLAVCVDPSGASQELLDAAMTWHEVFGGDLRVYEVVEPDGRPETPAPHELIDAARALRAPFRMVQSHDPAAALVDLTFAEGVSLAVGSHLRHGIARALLGSVAFEVVHRSATPVLVVPGD